LKERETEVWRIPSGAQDTTKPSATSPGSHDSLSWWLYSRLPVFHRVNMQIQAFAYSISTRKMTSNYVSKACRLYSYSQVSTS
jgi:hypothetical protein